jgi:hypothetical protein
MAEEDPFVLSLSGMRTRLLALVDEELGGPGA